MQLINLLDAHSINIERRILSKEQVYDLMAQNICRQRKMPLSAREIVERVLKRDSESTTAYASGIAIPHIRLDGFEDTLIAMTFLQNPLDYEGTKINWVVLIITDKTSSKLYLNTVAALLRLSKDSRLVNSLIACQDGQSAYYILKQSDIKIKEELTIADIMNQKPLSIRPDALIHELSDLMSGQTIPCVPVTDAQNNYLGEVNILNLLAVGVPHYLMMIDNLNFLLSYEPLEHLFEKLDAVYVHQIMSKEDKTIRPQASIIEAVSEMLRHHRFSMSVVQDGKLLGVITAMDVLKKVVQA